MLTYATTLFHTTPFPKPLNLPNYQINLKTIDKCCPKRPLSLSSNNNFCNNGSTLSSLFWKNHKAFELKTKAAAIPESADDEASKNTSFTSVLQLGSMFVVWYSLNIWFNIYNKQVLKVFPYPATVSAFQFGCGTVIVLLMWSFNLHPKPKINRSQFSAILVLSVTHTLGNLLTNISLGKVAVSFTHTIKAMEPFFTVVLSTMLMGERPSIWVVASLLPIVGGVALASFTETSFNWIGFGSAMASNLTNQSRNVFSKKLLVKKEDTLNNINLFSIVTIISFVLLVPIAILIDGIKLTPSYIANVEILGLSTKQLFQRALLSGFCFHMYQQVSYMILQVVSPVTHAVGNSVKRVVVIAASVIFFQTPVSPINSLGFAFFLPFSPKKLIICSQLPNHDLCGYYNISVIFFPFLLRQQFERSFHYFLIIPSYAGTSIALAGVFLYSRAKRMNSKPKVA